MSDAVTRSLKDTPAALIDAVYCDINGERHRVDEWAFTALRVGTVLRDASAYESPAGSCGDVGAASAVLASVLAVQAWQRGYAAGPRALVWTSSWRGLRGAMVLEGEPPQAARPG